MKENEVHCHNKWDLGEQEHGLERKDDRTRTKSNAFHVTRMRFAGTKNEKDALVGHVSSALVATENAAGGKTEAQ